jgi:hypothetical protein
MKNLLFAIIFLPAFAFAQADFSNITKAISKGDVETLAQYFDSSVELAINGTEDIYDKSEAKEQVKAFFLQSSPKSFSEVHKGTSKGNDAQYCIGNLAAGTKQYRVYIYLKSVKDKNLIRELRIDKE